MFHRAIRPALWMTILLSAVPAAATDRDCSGTDSLKNNPFVESGKVTSGGPKTFFIKGETDDKACPASTPACQRKAFLVSGNSVLVSGGTGAFACVTYVNGKGVETDGWMASGALTMDPPGAAMLARGWMGTWVRDEAKVTIKAGSAGALAIHGDATFGIHDPQRVKNGSVNMARSRARLARRAIGSASLWATTATRCPSTRVTTARARYGCSAPGDYLLLNDNNNCGGMNVSFRGTYVQP